MASPFARVASGDYETPDGFRCYRIPGVNPPAWNVERMHDDGHEEMIVDGAASMADAIEIWQDWVNDHSPEPDGYRADGRPCSR